MTSRSGCIVSLISRICNTTPGGAREIPQAVGRAQAQRAVDSLRTGKHTVDNREDSTLLNSRGAFKTVSIDSYTSHRLAVGRSYAENDIDFRSRKTEESNTSQKLGFQFHVIEVVDSFIVVGLDLSLRMVLVSMVLNHNNPAVSPPRR
jgi:hypothetical protein